MAKAYKKNILESFKDPMDIERQLVDRLSSVGQNELKRRRKAGLSSFYARNGRIVERLPDNTEQVREAVHSKWIQIPKGKRSIKLK